MSAWKAFLTGLGRALRYWQVLLVLYLVNLLAALLLAAPAALSLLGAAQTPVLYEMADGLDAWLLLDQAAAPALASLDSAGGQPAAGSGIGALFSLLAAGALPLVSWLLGSLLSGGVLLTFKEAPAPFSWRRFAWGCWRWLGAFLVLSLLQALLFAVVPIPAIILVLIVASETQWVLWLAGPLLAGLLALLLAWFEITRVFSVLDPQFSIFQALGDAGRFLWRNPLRIGGLYGLALMALLAVHAVFRLGLMPILPLAAWPLVLLVQQVFIWMRLYARSARLAGAVELSREDNGWGKSLTPGGVYPY